MGEQDSKELVRAMTTPDRRGAPLFPFYKCRLCLQTVPVDSADLLRAEDDTCICCHCVRHYAGGKQIGPMYRVALDINQSVEDAERNTYTVTDGVPSDWEQYGKNKRWLDPPAADQMPE